MSKDSTLAVNPEKTWVMELLALVAIPVLGYTMGLSYELGYASYFDIPYGLIKYDPSSILVVLKKAFLPVLGGGSITFLIANYFRKMPAIYVYFERFFWLIGIIFASFIACPNCWGYYLTVLAFCLIFFIIWLLDPLLNWKDKKTFLEKVEAQLHVDFARQQKSELTKLVNFLGGPSVWNTLIWIFVFAISLCWIIGRGDASNIQSFAILHSDKNLVVLKIYGDNIIAAPYDREKGEVKKEFYIIKVGENNADFIKIEKIGKLKPTSNNEESLTDKTTETSITH